MRHLSYSPPIEFADGYLRLPVYVKIDKEEVGIGHIRVCMKDSEFFETEELAQEPHVTVDF